MHTHAPTTTIHGGSERRRRRRRRPSFTSLSSLALGTISSRNMCPRREGRRSAHDIRIIHVHTYTRYKRPHHLSPQRDDDCIPRETPPHPRTARAQLPAAHRRRHSRAPTTADTGNTIPQRANPTQTAYTERDSALWLWEQFHQEICADEEKADDQHERPRHALARAHGFDLLLQPVPGERSKAYALVR